MPTKYSDETRQLALTIYMNDPSITQKQLAIKLGISYGTVQNWLKHRTNGLTQFQRFVRNRNNVIRKRHKSITEKIYVEYEKKRKEMQRIKFEKNQKIKNLRKKRDQLATEYGITPSTLRQVAYRTALRYD